MSYLILVKHALPEIQPGIAPNQWHLSPEGRERARRLPAQLAGYDLEGIYASQEPKAIETAEIIASEFGLVCQIEAGLHEHVRPMQGLFNQADFEAKVASLFAHPNQLIFGSETADQAHQRFKNAVDGVLDRKGQENLAIVAHGTVISLFVSRACGLEPGSLWRSLGLPSYVVLEHHLVSSKHICVLNQIVEKV